MNHTMTEKNKYLQIKQKKPTKEIKNVNSSSKKYLKSRSRANFVFLTNLSQWFLKISVYGLNELTDYQRHLIMTAVLRKIQTNPLIVKYHRQRTTPL